MARMGHDSERAAMIYQHQARGADRAITSAIDAHVEAERGERRAAMTVSPGHLARSAMTLMARGPSAGCAGGLSEVGRTTLTWDYTLERAKVPEFMT
jgi:hypothetical protein